METRIPDGRSALYQSERGEIACLAHEPFTGSDSWNHDRWAPITQREAADFEREIGRAPSCETCAAMARNGARR